MRPVLLALALCAHAALGQSDPEIGAVEMATQIVYYDVEGATAAELGASMSVQSPSKARPKFFGVTEWEVNAEYRWVERPTGCRIEDTVIRLLVRTHLPRWRPRGAVDPALRRAWGDFVRYLDVHEAHHRTLIGETGEALRWRLVSLREPTCATIEAAADRVIEAALGDGQEKNEAYDRETGHGQTQGAVWPPLPRGRG